jgi:CheY-like chemotaxis protein
MAYSVLIVDDEDLTLRTISRGLIGEGFEVLTAGSGEEALQLFEDEKPDLVLLDIVLPGIGPRDSLLKSACQPPFARIELRHAS